MRSERAWDERLVGFRALTAGDVPLVHRWLNAPHVTGWYVDESTDLNEVAAKYAPKPGDPTDPTESYLILYDGRPIGNVQTYRLADYPENAVHVATPEEIAAGAAGLDLFIGEADYQHRGLGPVLMRRFLREIVFGRNGAPACLLDPDPANGAAIRAYEKTGFHHVKTVRLPESRVPSYVIRVTQSDLDKWSRRQGEQAEPGASVGG